MKLNKISAVVPPEQETQVIKHIKDAKVNLDFLVNLNSQQRIRMAKLSRGRVDFVDTSSIHMQSNPEYLPVYVNFEEFVKDVELKNSLHRILVEVKAFGERLTDTIMQVESEAYRASRLYYKSAKAAALEGAEDAERIVRDLSYHHKRMGSSKNGTNDMPDEEEIVE
jgi:hypothetical protein